MAVTKTFNITLDVSTPLNTEEFRVKQGDTGNVFVITLKDSGAPVDLSNCRVVAVFTHGDSIAMQDNWISDGGISIGGDDHNIITIDLFNGSFVPGLNECEIQVYSGEELDTLITSAAFNFRCARTLFNEDTILAMKEYSILTSLISTVQRIVNGAQSNWTESDSTDSTFIKNKPIAFAPAAHAASHASAGADAVTPASIGAAASTHAGMHASGGTDPVTPAAIGATVKATATVTLPVADWSNKSQTVSVTGVTDSNTVVVSPEPASRTVYAESGVYCSAQGPGTLTFLCEDVPASALTVNVLMLT